MSSHRAARPTRMAGADVEIRPARADDAPALAALLAELGFPAPPEVLVARLAAMPDGDVLVAVREGVPVGVVTLHVTPVLHRPTTVGRITALVVAGHDRGHGIGAALVTAAERALGARGCALVEVTSNHRLADAHRFYERLGYESTSVRFARVLPPPA